GRHSQAPARFTGGTIIARHRFHGPFDASGAPQEMNTRSSLMAMLASSTFALVSCQTAPPPVVRPAAFTPLGVSAPYLSGDVIGGRKARVAKMRAAKIKPLSPAAAGT